MAKYVFVSTDDSNRQVEIRFDSDGYVIGYDGDVPLVGEHVDTQVGAIAGDFALAEVHLLGAEADRPEYIEQTDGTMTFPDHRPDSAPTSPRDVRTVDFHDAFFGGFELRAVLDEEDRIVSLLGPMVMIAEDYRRQYGFGIKEIANKMRFAPVEHEGEPPPIADLMNEPEESFSEVVERARKNAARRRAMESGHDSGGSPGDK